eukprot:1161734-Pelagomonas_calceolata.AAC.18
MHARLNERPQSYTVVKPRSRKSVETRAVCQLSARLPVSRFTPAHPQPDSPPKPRCVSVQGGVRVRWGHHIAPPVPLTPQQEMSDQRNTNF